MVRDHGRGDQGGLRTRRGSAAKLGERGERLRLYQRNRLRRRKLPEMCNPRPFTCPPWLVYSGSL